MFGLFPKYLKAMGYKVKTDSVLNENNLKNTDVVVIINLDKNISDIEKEKLKKFITDGGSLLVLGDHTGLGGIMEPLNDLLSFTKIRFNFDCGHYLKNDFRDEFELTSHPIFKGINDEIDVGISVGASLAISPLTSRPILFAKYGFSDNGDSSDVRNAYLGNRHYDEGELLGDIILVAESSLGKGKILVFGDTSSFQNGAIFYSFRFVQNVFGYLTSFEPWNNSLIIRSILLVLLLTALIAFVSEKIYKRPGEILWITLGLILVILLSYSLRQTVRTNVKSNQHIAYIDASHLNKFSQYGDDGIWALAYQLMRNKYLPVVEREFQPRMLNKSSTAFFITPLAQINSIELDSIDKFVRRGGTAVFSFGYEDKAPMKNMLQKFGFNEDNVPLGPVPDSETTAKVQFSKAWPVKVQDKNNVDTLCSGWGYPIIVSRKIGQGRIVLAADPLFFLSENLEANHAYPNYNNLFMKIVSSGDIKSDNPVSVNKYPGKITKAIVGR